MTCHYSNRRAPGGFAAYNIDPSEALAISYYKNPTKQKNPTTRILQPTRNAKVPHHGFLAQWLMAGTEPLNEDGSPLHHKAQTCELVMQDKDGLYKKEIKR